MEENTYKSPTPAEKRKPQIRLVLFVVGILLTFAPIFGVLPTVWGTVAAMNQEQPNFDELSDHVNVGLVLTAAGLLVCPVGIALAVVSGIKLMRKNRIGGRDRKQITAFIVALGCYSVAIALRLTKDDNWLVLHWIFLSIGSVAFIIGASVYGRR